MEMTINEYSTHIVLPSDTLVGIALKYGMNVQQLKSINGMYSTAIYPGMVKKKKKKTIKITINA